MSTSSTARSPSTTRRMVLMLTLSLIVFGGIFGVKWFGSKQMNAMFDNMQPPPATITAAVAREETWDDSLEAVGTLVAINGTDVTTEAGGVVRAIRFEAGQPVRKGEVLIELNTENEVATLRALEAAARLAVTQRDRWRELATQRLVSRDEVDQRVADAAAAVARVEAQRALIEQKTIRAPFDGILGIRRINLGQYVQPGSPLVSLQSMDPIYLNFTLPEQRMGQVGVGAIVRATVDALPGQTFEGRVTAIEPGVDASTRNFTVQATLRNPDRALRPGTFAKVGFDTGARRDVIVIPQTAVSFNPYGNSVYVIGEAAKQGGQSGGAAQPAQGDAPQGPTLTVSQRFVKTGVTRGDLVAVLDGLKPGERVASSGLLKLRNGATVIVDNKVQPNADAKPSVTNK